MRWHREILAGHAQKTLGGLLCHRLHLPVGHLKQQQKKAKTKENISQGLNSCDTVISVFRISGKCDNIAVIIKKHTQF